MTPFTLASESVPARVSTLPFVGINANEPRRTVLAGTVERAVPARLTRNSARRVTLRH